MSPFAKQAIAETKNIQAWLGKPVDEGIVALNNLISKGNHEAALVRLHETLPEWMLVALECDADWPNIFAPRVMLQDVAPLSPFELIYSPEMATRPINRNSSPADMFYATTNMINEALHAYNTHFARAYGVDETLSWNKLVKWYIAHKHEWSKVSWAVNV